MMPRSGIASSKNIVITYGFRLSGDRQKNGMDMPGAFLDMRLIGGERGCGGKEKKP
jgi:hypothetical protein